MDDPIQAREGRLLNRGYEHQRTADAPGAWLAYAEHVLRNGGRAGPGRLDSQALLRSRCGTPPPAIEVARMRGLQGAGALRSNRYRPTVGAGCAHGGVRHPSASMVVIAAAPVIG